MELKEVYFETKGQREKPSSDQCTLLRQTARTQNIFSLRYDFETEKPEKQAMYPRNQNTRTCYCSVSISRQTSQKSAHGAYSSSFWAKEPEKQNILSSAWSFETASQKNRTSSYAFFVLKQKPIDFEIFQRPEKQNMIVSSGNFETKRQKNMCWLLLHFESREVEFWKYWWWGVRARERGGQEGFIYAHTHQARTCAARTWRLRAQWLAIWRASVCSWGRGGKANEEANGYLRSVTQEL